MYCSQCGTKTREGDSYCGTCGFQLKGNSPEAATAPAQSLERPRLAITAVSDSVPAPSYGFTVNRLQDRIDIHVKARSIPLKNFATILCVILFFVVGACFGAVSGYLSNNDPSLNEVTSAASSGAWCGAIIGLLGMLLLYRLFKFAPAYRPTEISITPRTFSINGKAYERAHIHSLTSRWTSLSSPVFSVGQAAIINGIASIFAARSYRITFDYGNVHTCVASNLNEATCNRLLEAIEAALAEIA